MISSAALLLVLLAGDLVKGSNYAPEQVFYNQHSHTPNPFSAVATATNNNEKLSPSEFARFIIGRHSLPPTVIKITERFAVKVPYAQLIPVPHNVPYPFAVPISKPFPVEVPQLINLNQDDAQGSPSDAPHLPQSYGESTKAIDYAQNYREYGSQISQEVLPPY